jgi:hypothetical protein
VTGVKFAVTVLFASMVTVMEEDVPDTAPDQLLKV